MAGVNQIFSLADDIARYVKACGKRSILECKPLTGKLDASKMMWLKPSEVNSATGNPIARNVFEVPKAKDGWISLTHCSRSGAKGIKETGLYYYTAGDYDSTTLVQELPDLLDEFKMNPDARGFYGDDILMFQMPYKEYKLMAYSKRHYAKNLGYNPNLNWTAGVELLIPPKYVVAHLERKDIINMTAKQMSSALRSQPEPLSIKPTDLRHLNPGRPRKYKLSELDFWAADDYTKYKRLAEKEPKINISEDELLSLVSPNKPGVKRKETPMMKELLKREKEQQATLETQTEVFDDDGDFEEFFKDFGPIQANEDDLLPFDELVAKLKKEGQVVDEHYDKSIFDFEF